MKRSDLDPLVIFALKLTATVLVIGTGFFAISDDDFARMVIAERFAGAPSLDPSKTSWLPIPFWIYGTAMALFGRSLAVAQLTAAVLGAGSAVIVHRAALWLGLSRRAAFGGASIAALFPHALWLGAAPVPETLSASLSVLALGSVTSVIPRRRLVAALGLLAATLSRYETWPIAAFFALVCLLDASRIRPTRERLVGAAAASVALIGPIAWMAHGIVAHADAFFFLKRVAAYRSALGGHSSPIEALSSLWRFVQGEPELTLSLLVLATLVSRPGATEWLHKYRRSAMGVALLLAFLAMGEALGGAPTHHPGRPLLAAWYLCALAWGDALFLLLARGRPGQARLSIGTVSLAATAGIALRMLSPHDQFSPRQPERAIGDLARQRLPPRASLLIDTADYGYFAVMASFGAPERAWPLVDHDPRDPGGPNPLATPADLARALARADADFVVVDDEHRAVARAIGTPIARAAPFELYRVFSGEGDVLSGISR